MRRRLLALLAPVVALTLVACSDPVGPAAEQVVPDALLAPSPQACWGQATKVFARMGVMGEHAAEQPTPRVGLANLARELYNQGVLSEPTLRALGQFVAADLGLDVDACL